MIADEGKVKSLCGNGIVEENEECDIGFPEEDVEDKCCNRDCKFKPGAQCRYVVIQARLLVNCCRFDCQLILGHFYLCLKA